MAAATVEVTAHGLNNRALVLPQLYSRACCSVGSTPAYARVIEIGGRIANPIAKPVEEPSDLLVIFQHVADNPTQASKPTSSVVMMN